MKKIIALFLAAIAIMLFSAVAFADFGDFAGDSDYDYSDYEESYDYDSDWDSGWDSGYEYYDDYEKEYYYEDDNSENITFGEFVAVMGIITAVLLVGMFKDAASDKFFGNKKIYVPKTKPMINGIEDLKERDPLFSEAKFLGEVSNTYVKMQDCWSERDISSLRPYFTEELFAKSERQINGYISRGETNHVERVAVLGTKIVGCEKDSENDVITVEINSRIADYVTDDKTGKIIRGDKNRELFMTYRWTYIRPLGKLTEEENGITETECPGCGAPVDINRSAVCEYCGAVCINSDHGWVISDIQGISQRS